MQPGRVTPGGGAFPVPGRQQPDAFSSALGGSRDEDMRLSRSCIGIDEDAVGIGDSERGAMPSASTAPLRPQSASSFLSRTPTGEEDSFNASNLRAISLGDCSPQAPYIRRSVASTESTETTMTVITNCNPVEGDGLEEVPEARHTAFEEALPRRRGVVTYSGKLFYEEEEQKPKTRCWQTLRYKHFAKICRRIVDHKYFVFVSVLLTFFALMGDDIKLLAFDKGADLTFNFLTILCMAFFSMEVLLSCFGKSDYFLGFFFFLDAIATVTLVMDLTWVSEFIMSGGGQGDMELGDKARSGRTARLGASVGRMVRVLRLIRIFKLYKAYLANKQRRKREEAKRKKAAEDNEMRLQQMASGGGRRPSLLSSPMRQHLVNGEMQHSPNKQVDKNMFDTDEDEEREWVEEEEQRALNKEEGDAKESLVGKKLSALTTRRVIILVLTMLLVLPTLRVLDPVTPEAPAYAADMIFEAFREYESGSASHEIYERALLKLIYYHNWFTGQSSCDNNGCPNDFFAHIFWVGSAGLNATYVQGRVGKAKLPQAAVAAWDQAAGYQDDLYNFGVMPKQVLPLLHQDWNVECKIYGTSHFGISLTQLEVPGKLDKPFRCPADLRLNEWMRVAPRMLTNTEYKAFHLVFFLDLRPYVKLEAIYGISVTVFVCFVLCVASIYFSKDANRLVLQPLEAMMAKIEAIRENPLVAVKMADDEFKMTEVKRMKAQRSFELKKLSWLGRCTGCFGKCHGSSAKKVEATEMYETVILEKTLVKLGWLLSLVYGEAGANIVSQNMSGNATAGVNAMVAGTRVECIIGHARIRDFSTATEVLQEKVMTFVNQVAEIVHGIADQYHGASNQNNGNTFLLIWRMFGLEKEKAAKLGDLSVLAFAKILSSIHRSRVLAAYRAHPGLQQRLGSNHKVSMTFGLHAGWAIEGAVGSEFKIDASYLSPNVTIASSLQRATNHYGVSFLASQAVLMLCHKKMVNKCRLIDKVMLRGFTQHLALYTLDLDYDNLLIDQPRPKFLTWNVRQRFRARQLLESEKMKKWSADLHSENSVDQQDITEMRKIYTFEFVCLFNRGYQNYSQGEWQVAKRVLSQTHTMLGIRDGPSGALLSFMEAPYQFVAPEDWNGLRTLDVDANEE